MVVWVDSWIIGVLPVVVSQIGSRVYRLMFLTPIQVTACKRTRWSAFSNGNNLPDSRIHKCQRHHSIANSEPFPLFVGSLVASLSPDSSSHAGFKMVPCRHIRTKNLDDSARKCAVYASAWVTPRSFSRIGTHQVGATGAVVEPGDAAATSPLNARNPVSWRHSV